MNNPDPLTIRDLFHSLGFEYPGEGDTGDRAVLIITPNDGGVGYGYWPLRSVVDGSPVLLRAFTTTDTRFDGEFRRRGAMPPISPVSWPCPEGGFCHARICADSCRAD